MNKKHALVCGSSKGIGASTAIELSKLGATITLLARDKDSLANVLDSLDNPNVRKYDWRKEEWLIWKRNILQIKSLHQTNIRFM